jgi:hypothetical protein
VTTRANGEREHTCLSDSKRDRALKHNERAALGEPLAEDADGNRGVACLDSRPTPVSNRAIDAGEARDPRMAEKRAEKAFRKYFENLGAPRWSAESTKGNHKRFEDIATVAFVARALNSRARRAMSDATFGEDLARGRPARQMARLRAFMDVDGACYPKPLTNKQREILVPFGIAIPNGTLVNRFIKETLK